MKKKRTCLFDAVCAFAFNFQNLRSCVDQKPTGRQVRSIQLGTVFRQPVQEHSAILGDTPGQIMTYSSRRSQQRTVVSGATCTFDIVRQTCRQSKVSV